MTETANALDLGRLLSERPLSPAQAAAVGLGVLTALEDLHEAGRSAGTLRPEDVLIGRNGRVRLRGNGQEHPSSSEQMADLRQAGQVICSALAIPLEPDPASVRPAERAMPAVCATARAIAKGAMGRNVALARASFADTAGSLVAPERLRLSETELAELTREMAAGNGFAATAAPAPAPAPAPPPVAARPTPPPAPAPPPRAIPPPARAPEPPAPRPVSNWEQRNRITFTDEDRAAPPLGRIAAVAGVLLVLVLAIGLGVFIIRSLMLGNESGNNVAVTQVNTSPSAAARQSPAATAHPSPAASPTGVPQYAPASQGTVKSVQLAVRPDGGSCTVGGRCDLETTVTFTLTTSPVEYDWTFKVYDPCTGASTDAGTDKLTAQSGWNHVISDRTISLPSAKGVLYLVAVTTSPDQAASQPLSVGSGSC